MKIKQQHQKAQSIARTATTVNVISSTSAVASKFPELQDLSPVTVKDTGKLQTAFSLCMSLSVSDCI